MYLPDALASEQVGYRLAAYLQIGDVVTLSGTLGAGKTTVARGLIQGLGFSGEVASPSFPLIIPYEIPEVRLALWHVDLYRIEKPQEIAELGLDELLQDGVLLIEWPERLPPHYWPHALTLTLSILSSGVRILTAQVPAAWDQRWPV